MSETWVIHWSSQRETGQALIVGDEAAAARAILGSETFAPDEVTKVERYDTDEHVADDVTEDMARLLACGAQDAEWRGGDGITPELRDFIERHGGLAWTAGLRVIDTSFAAV